MWYLALVLFLLGCGDLQLPPERVADGSGGAGGSVDNEGGNGGIDDGEGGYRSPVCKTNCVVGRYEWSTPDPAIRYFFDGVNSYEPTFTDPYAFMINVPVVTGDSLQVQITGEPRSEKPEPNVTCTVQVHALYGTEWTHDFSAATPVTTGGNLSFSAVSQELPLTLRGVYLAPRSGSVWLVLLGKTSYPDHFCGLGGQVHMLVTQVRP